MEVQNQTFSQKSKVDFLQSSKQTALKFKQVFPKAELYPFGPDNNSCHWGWKTMPGCNNIEGYTKPCYWGLKMSSVPLCVLDFDILPKDTGMSEKQFKKLIEEFKLTDYPFFTKSRSGKGGHYWFKDENAPQNETNMDIVQGIDYKVNSMLFLKQFPFEIGLKGLRDLPPEYLVYQKYSKPKTKKGRFHTQQADSYKAMIKGSPSGVFEAYRIARNKGQTITEAMSVAGPSLGKMDIVPDPTPTKTAVKKNLTAPVSAKNTQAQKNFIDIKLHEKTPITDINWGIEDWFEYGELSLIGGESGGSKTTLAIKLAVLNGMKREFWPGGPKGDGRKSLYICFERKGEKAHNKELACGGDGNQIDIIKELSINGKATPINLENKQHLTAILQMIRKNNYWCVILDPVIDLVLSSQNDNAKVRQQVALILKQTHNLKTIFFGIAHLRKSRIGINELGGFRGASELVNMATSVCRVFELKDGDGYVLCKLKVNESKTGKKGAIKYKVETLEIPDIFLAKGSKEKGKGGIKSLTYLDKPLSEVKKLCVKELDITPPDDSKEVVRRVIEREKAYKRELNTTVIRNLAVADGVSFYYLNKKLNWADFGYEARPKGKGKELRYILYPISE